MEAMLVRERYKVVRALDVRENYACLEAVDLLDREKGVRLLNLYEGPLLRAYLADFDKMAPCGSFVELFVERGSLVSVFTDVPGVPIDQVFFQRDGHDWRTRLYYAGALLDRALELADLPPALSCAAMVSENVRVDLLGQQVCLRFKAVPLEGMDARELAWLTGDQLKKILRPGAGSPMELLDFLAELEGGRQTGVVDLYRLWRAWSSPLYEAHEALERKGFFQRWLGLGWSRLKRWFKGRKRRRTG